MRRGALTVKEEVRRLAPLGLAELRMVWTERIGAPPTLRSPDLLRLMLAWRMQAGAMGGIDADLRCQLARRGRAVVEGQSLGHGAVLRRIWQGRLIEAIVEDGGFRFEGRRYASLSAVAEAATGTRWNGPRFFGLRPAGKGWAPAIAESRQ